MRSLGGRALMALLLLALPACSTLGPKAWIAGAALSGGALGATAGATLSPNSESRALNALVFGLIGVVAGGGSMVALMPASPKVEAMPDLRTREMTGEPGSREYLARPAGPLPEYLKSRVQPAVIEEFIEKDEITDEGTLHEPHKAYRIKRPAELIARPVGSESGGTHAAAK